MLKEFREFAIKGNAIDLAVGVIIGAAFTAIVNSLVKDVIMPPIGALIGGADFSNMFWVIKGGSYDTLAAANEAGAATLNYGLFINAVINFVLVALVVFLMVKVINKLRGPANVVVTTKECPYCASEIALTATRCPACTSQLTEGAV